MAGDATVDDPVALKAFYDWMGTFVAPSQSPVSANGETISKKTQSPASESHPDETLSEEHQVEAHRIQDQAGLEIPNGATPKSLTASEIHKDEDPFQGNTHGESPAQPVVISVAHKRQSLADVKLEETDNEPSSQHVAEVSEIKFEDSSKDQKTGSAVPKRGNGLLDSNHAPQARKGLKFSTFRGHHHYPPDVSIMPAQSSPVQMEDGTQYDPMEYFDNKRKEYYPASAPPSSGPKVMLQSKDPNVSMKSPKKEVASKLNPQAHEYLTAMPAQDQVADERFDLTPMLNVIVARDPKAPETGGKDKVDSEASTAVCENDELLEVYLDCGATRAVQAEGVDLDMTMRSLYQIASGTLPASSREVECIHDSLSGGVRKVVFRFASVKDAVALRSSLRRDAEWKTKRIEFVDDPYA